MKPRRRNLEWIKQLLGDPRGAEADARRTAPEIIDIAAHRRPPANSEARESKARPDPLDQDVPCAARW